jgi:microcompartment protein CcmK/EutM
VRLCRVIGSVTAAVKHPAFDARPLMIVQPIDEKGEDHSSSLLAIDTVQAGPGDTVLVMSEGNGVRQILASGPQTPIRSLIVGVVDQVSVG